MVLTAPRAGDCLAAANRTGPEFPLPVWASGVRMKRMRTQWRVRILRVHCDAMSQEAWRRSRCSGEWTARMIMMPRRRVRSHVHLAGNLRRFRVAKTSVGSHPLMIPGGTRSRSWPLGSSYGCREWAPTAHRRQQQSQSRPRSCCSGRFAQHQLSGQDYLLFVERASLKACDEDLS
jgi:hypothetical protein